MRDLIFDLNAKSTPATIAAQLKRLQNTQTAHFRAGHADAHVTFTKFPGDSREGTVECYKVAQSGLETCSQGAAAQDVYKLLEPWNVKAKKGLGQRAWDFVTGNSELVESDTPVIEADVKSFEFKFE